MIDPGLESGSYYDVHMRELGVIALNWVRARRVVIPRFATWKEVVIRRIRLQGVLEWLVFCSAE